MDHALNRRCKFHKGAKCGKARNLAFNSIAGLEAFKQGVQLFGAFALNDGAVRNHNVSATVFNPYNQKLHAAAHKCGGVFCGGNANLAAGAEGRLAKHLNSVATLAYGGYAAINRNSRIAGFFKRGNTAAAHGAGKANFLRRNAGNPRFEAIAGLNAFIALSVKNVLAVNDAVNLDAHVHKNTVAGNGNYSSGHFLSGLQAAGCGFVGRQHGGKILSAFLRHGGCDLVLGHSFPAPYKLGLLLKSAILRHPHEENNCLFEACFWGRAFGA